MRNEFTKVMHVYTERDTDTQTFSSHLGDVKGLSIFVVWSLTSISLSCRTLCL